MLIMDIYSEPAGFDSLCLSIVLPMLRRYCMYIRVLLILCFSKEEGCIWQRNVGGDYASSRGMLCGVSPYL